jgi:lysophospholipase L1-like esterase
MEQLIKPFACALNQVSGDTGLDCGFQISSAANPVTFSKVTVALQSYAANLVADSSTVVTFNRKSNVTIQPGERIFSDPVRLRFVPEGDAERCEGFSLAGRNLAVSFAVQGKTGPMTSHNAAYHTSYISPSGSGDHTGDLTGANYPYSTTSWLFLDAVDVLAPSDTAVICAFGDSITDGQFSTINGNDRWPNAFSDRIHAVYGDRVSVVNEGIAGNTVVNPAQIGPAAVDRLDRDVLSLSGLTAVIWLEGINDFGAESDSPGAVIAGLTDGINRMHAQGIKVIGATITSSLGCTLLPNWGTTVTDSKRKTTNDFIRHSGLYDGVADMDAATLDSASGQLQPEFVPDSAKGRAGRSVASESGWVRSDGEYRRS